MSDTAIGVLAVGSGLLLGYPVDAALAGTLLALGLRFVTQIIVWKVGL